ncbi:hypothetical protein SESBI_18701 [Sesbania bispinosa]|nr:hypothetical protein SESBI_18701 [Sesbania bispinosa]
MRDGDVKAAAATWSSTNGCTMKRDFFCARRRCDGMAATLVGVAAATSRHGRSLRREVSWSLLCSSKTASLPSSVCPLLRRKWRAGIVVCDCEAVEMVTIS